MPVTGILNSINWKESWIVSKRQRIKKKKKERR